MASFVEKSNCRGIGIKGAAGTHHNLRPEITGRLLQERHVARYVVAPKGYGKSAVAYEYTQIVFGFAHTFWLECTSPCFIRDLDAGSLLEQILKCDPAAQLVVFDDVPRLDPDRSAAFDAVVEGLLAADVEVVATCTPSVDAFTSLRSDGVVLRAHDLLLTDDELSVERLRDGLPTREGDVVSKAERAACLIWDAKGPDVLLKGFKSEDLPGDLRLASLLILLFEEGSFVDFEDVLARPLLSDDIAFLDDNYPFLGIDVPSRSFRSISVDVAEASKHLGFPMRELSLSSSLDAPELSKRISDKLLERGHSARAATFIRLAADKAVSAEWLAAVGWPMVMDLEPLAVESLFEPVRKHASDATERITAIGAWAAFAMQDAKAVKKRCRSVLRSSRAEWQDLTACLMLASRADGGFEVEKHGMEVERIHRLQQLQDASGASGATRHDPLDWECVLALMLASCEGEDAFLGTWDDFVVRADAGGPATPWQGAPALGCTAPERLSNALLVFAAWRMQSLLDVGLHSPDAGVVVRRLADFAGTRIRGEGASAIPRWVRMVTGKALHACSDAFPTDFDLAMPSPAESDLMQMRAYLSGQAKELRRRREQAEMDKERYRATHPDPFRAQGGIVSKGVAVRSHTPLLKIGLFGSFDAHIEDETCRPCAFRRKKARLLLAILAINRGREVSRERLTKMLWPDSNEDFCKRNFYVIWGSLKRELSVNGSCPYLLRSQTGCRLDARFVSTDLDDFDRLSRSLLFGGEGVVSWEDAFERITHQFAEDFLPEIVDNEFVSDLRVRYKDQMVDSLISASARLGTLGEPRGSLWFAREALRRDELREDSYMALMNAQIASNQRGAALETYFACRRVLVERLGIDPSAAIVELYNSIIESEETF